MVRTAAQVASLGGKGQGISGLSENIIRYPHRTLTTPLYKALPAEGQAGEAVSYFYKSFLSNPGD